MKYKILLCFIQFLLIHQYTFSQGKIKPDVKTLTFLGKSPSKTKSNCLPENLIKTIFFTPQPKSNSKIGFMDNKGKIVIKPIYNMASDFYNGFANIIKDSTYGYINKKGIEVLFKNYDETYFYYNNTGIAKKNGKYALIDRKGSPLTEFKYNSILFFGFDHFRGLISGNFGHILDNKGKIIFNKNLEYDIKSEYFDKDSLLVYEKTIDGNSLKGIVKIDNTIIIEPKYDNIDLLENEDFLLAEKDQKFGLIDKSGKEIIPLIYDKIKAISENLILVKQKDKWGFIDKLNKIIIPLEYDDAFPFFNGIAFVQKESFYGAIDKHNQTKIQFNLDKLIFPIDSDNLIVFKKNEKFGFINSSGKIIVQAIYDYAYPFIKDMAYVQRDNKAGFINRKGEQVIPINYKQLWLESEKLIRFTE